MTNYSIANFNPIFDSFYDEPAPEPTPTPEPSPKPGDKKVEFSPEQQEFVNSLLAKEKQKLRKDIDTLTSKVAAANGNEAKLSELSQQLEQLQLQYQTKEEQLQHQYNEKLKAAETARDTNAAEVKTWKSLYETSTIERSIIDGATEAGAFEHTQMVELLANKTSLYPVLGSDNKPTGHFEAKTKITLTDAEGKPVELLLTPAEAQKRMKESPKYANLFKSNVVGGLGMNRQQKVALSELAKDPAAYRAARKAQMQGK